MLLGLLIAAFALPILVFFTWMGAAHVHAWAWHRRHDPARPALGAAAHVRAWLEEARAFAVLGVWHVIAWPQDDLRWPGVVASGPPVLFVHGFTQNGTNGWGLRRRLEALGRPTAAVSLGLPFRSIHAHAAALTARLRELAAAFPDGFDVVAHSMGGVVLRYALVEHPDLAGRVRRVVTLGSPHAGTAGARLAPRGWRVDFSELAPHAPLFARLPSLSDLLPHADVTTVAAVGDLIVYPVATCHQPGARAIALPLLGHASLLTHPRALDVVIEAITASRSLLHARA